MARFVVVTFDTVEDGKEWFFETEAEANAVYRFATWALDHSLLIVQPPRREGARAAQSREEAAKRAEEAREIAALDRKMREEWDG